MDDRELDALVAEKVMGWHIAEHKRYPGSFIAIDSDGDTVYDSEGYERTATNPDAARWLYPHYSTDIAAAWAVVEHFDGYEAERLGMPLGSTIGGHNWVLWREAEEYHATADTAPRAICLAALKAVGIDV